ncbi:antidote-toxin recognition MazE family protein [Rickettsia felis str. Pedreira]|uniref:Antitoxin VapB2 n=2 Tax=Rickettsia felis TaxID=42862 RepID=VAPB2_RICFE|nr:type II toxin-antitoxin system VapB family antitoxin [Rickettsia felis]Q4UNB3.1 RecName: Full=Antitoxin VapB2 [Rickettsia felis URRWXCal2]3ZVK_E Chain E, Antitoxin Of Toxin-antitoxin System Vapb [Rickettsia felis]3ZVK_F Chain F, Antitoxin Of Toxin-antitoxin System Vapb [Rickettsia felis]3ZVK_G Chain G, Antitoxin Of Toxin-antitoxin System Vapb [Rickettsia felis]3ZVK_H Chain H, Antitoxin Of Toxin-antitoxin System Vapb [Rickettsia felis]AAY60945.1 Antitoxin of toxin-antitoxin system VapB [Ric
MNKAKIFMNGQSQAVRLPKEFRFSVKEVSVIPLGKGIVLQPLPNSWKDVFQEMAEISSDDIFPEGRKDLPPQKRKYFE